MYSVTWYVIIILCMVLYINNCVHLLCSVLYEDLDGYTEMAPLQMEDSGEYVIDSIVTTSPDQNHEYTEMVPTIEDSTEYSHVTGPSQDGNGGSGGRALANNTHTTQTSGYSNASESKGDQEQSNVNVQSVSTTQTVPILLTATVPTN